MTYIFVGRSKVEIDGSSSNSSEDGTPTKNSLPLSGKHASPVLESSGVVVSELMTLRVRVTTLTTSLGTQTTEVNKKHEEEEKEGRLPAKTFLTDGAPSRALRN